MSRSRRLLQSLCLALCLAPWRLAAQSAPASAPTGPAVPALPGPPAGPTIAPSPAPTPDASLWGAPIVDLALRGDPVLTRAQLLQLLPEDAALTPALVRSLLRSLYASGAIRDAEISARPVTGGVALVFTLSARLLITPHRADRDRRPRPGAAPARARPARGAGVLRRACGGIPGSSLGGALGSWLPGRRGRDHTSARRRGDRAPRLAPPGGADAGFGSALSGRRRA